MICYNSKGEPADFCGLTAHLMMSLDEIFTASFDSFLGITGRSIGWQFPRSGSKEITNAPVYYLQTLGGETVVSALVESVDKILVFSCVFVCDLE